jgi:preprotein translocase subunit SecY
VVKQEVVVLYAFIRAFRTPDLRRKLLFTMFIMALFRLGSFIPTPGVSYTAVRTCIDQASAGDNSLYQLVNLFSGGALLQLSIFALGIMPYITASIIVQLLTVVIPRFETLKQEGQTGTAKLTQYTRYLTIGLAVLQSTTLVAVAKQGLLFQGCTAQIVPRKDPVTLAIMVITMTAGTGLIMWLGETITEKGIGNGMSLLIFTSIAAGFPTSLWGIKTSKGFATFFVVIAVGLVILALVVFVEQCQRRIPVQYTKRMVGRKMYGGTSTYIPIKLNMAGVIPVIFASSLLYLPALLVQFQSDSTAGWVEFIQKYLAKGDHPLYMAIYVVLIIFFTYFYVAITFNPDEVADNMRKYGGFIQGIRAGKPTADYLAYVLSRVTIVGALYLAAISLIPLIALDLLDSSQNFPFGGTSILIVVGVGLETVKQIESQLQQRHYEGFLR